LVKTVSIHLNFYGISYSSLMLVLNQLLGVNALGNITDEQLFDVREQVDKTAKVISRLVQNRCTSKFTV
jgi:hypothetical protein